MNLSNILNIRDVVSDLNRFIPFKDLVRFCSSSQQTNLSVCNTNTFLSRLRANGVDSSKYNTFPGSALQKYVLTLIDQGKVDRDPGVAEYVNGTKQILAGYEYIIGLSRVAQYAIRHKDYPLLEYVLMSGPGDTILTNIYAWISLYDRALVNDIVDEIEKYTLEEENEVPIIDDMTPYDHVIQLLVNYKDRLSDQNIDNLMTYRIVPPTQTKNLQSYVDGYLGQWVHNSNTIWKDSLIGMIEGHQTEQFLYAINQIIQGTILINEAFIPTMKSLVEYIIESGTLPMLQSMFYYIDRNIYNLIGELVSNDRSDMTRWLLDRFTYQQLSNSETDIPVESIEMFRVLTSHGIQVEDYNILNGVESSNDITLLQMIPDMTLDPDVGISVLISPYVFKTLVDRLSATEIESLEYAFISTSINDMNLYMVNYYLKFGYTIEDIGLQYRIYELLETSGLVDLSHLPYVKKFADEQGLGKYIS